MTTTAPRVSARRPHSSLYALSDSPIRVPPDQSCTRAAAASKAASGSRTPSSGVRRVSRVPNANVSTPRPEPRAAWRYRSSARAYASIEPDTSRIRTSLRGAAARLRKARSTGSPPVASEARTSPRTSSARPFESGRSRACAARGRTTAIAWISFRARANSSGVIAAKSFLRSSSSSLHAPRLASPPSSSGPGPGGAPLRRSPARRRRLGRCGVSHRSAEEPGVKGPVERFDVLVSRHERLPQRPVDVVLPGELDGVETLQRVGDAAGPDLEPRLPQHAAERDDVPDDRASGHGRWRRARRASRRGRRAGPRGTSARSRASPGRSRRRAPARRAR